MESGVLEERCYWHVQNPQQDMGRWGFWRRRRCRRIGIQGHRIAYEDLSFRLLSLMRI